MSRSMMRVGLGILAAVCGVGLGDASASAAESVGFVPIGPLPQTRPVVSLACTSPGGAQDVGKTPLIKNTASVALAKGTAIDWTASDGDKGRLVLDADLAPGATVKALGKAGRAYTCNASYTALPDLVITDVKSVGPMTVEVEVANADPYADATPSQVRLDVSLCTGTGNPRHTLQSEPFALPKGAKKKLTFTYGPLFGSVSLHAVADAGGTVKESREGNNSRVRRCA